MIKSKLKGEPPNVVVVLYFREAIIQGVPKNVTHIVAIDWNMGTFFVTLKYSI